VSGALLALPSGLGIGLLLGLVGCGGSILAVPVLVYVLGQPVKAATTESLLIVGTAALVGAADYARSGRVQIKTALAFGAAGAAGAIAGTALNLGCQNSVRLGENRRFPGTTRILAGPT
jgi:uncharacterized membrane protein YfcA